jgi:hypothetical protein
MKDIATRLKDLEEQHKELEYNIAWGYSNYTTDDEMARMKKEKLRIKDEIEALRNHV